MKVSDGFVWARRFVGLIISCIKHHKKTHWNLQTKKKKQNKKTKTKTKTKNKKQKEEEEEEDIIGIKICSFSFTLDRNTIFS